MFCLTLIYLLFRILLLIFLLCFLFLLTGNIFVKMVSFIGWCCCYRSWSWWQIRLNQCGMYLMYSISEIIFFMIFIAITNLLIYIYIVFHSYEKYLKKLWPFSQSSSLNGGNPKIRIKYWHIWNWWYTYQIKEPIVCGITSLGMDHTEVLGAYPFLCFALSLLIDQCVPSLAMWCPASK